MSAPADAVTTLGQALQLLSRLKGLTKREFQRLIRNGDLLAMIAKVPASRDSAMMLRYYAYGYVPIIIIYRTNAHGMGGYVWESQKWRVRTGDGVYEDWLEHYGLEYAFEGPGCDLIAQAILNNWIEYETWFVQVNLD